MILVKGVNWAWSLVIPLTRMASVLYTRKSLCYRTEYKKTSIDDSIKKLISILPKESTLFMETAIPLATSKDSSINKNKETTSNTPNTAINNDLNISLEKTSYLNDIIL
jgi:hypothetical protein